MLESMIKYVLVSEEEIKSIVNRLGQEISRDYADKNLVLVSVLKGSILFTSDLAKQLSCVCEMEFVRTYSYGNGTESSGNVQMLVDVVRCSAQGCSGASCVVGVPAAWWPARRTPLLATVWNVAPLCRPSSAAVCRPQKELR